MDTDIRDEIERSFGDGPALTGDDELMARAHRALRRRRGAESAAAALVTVVALSGAVLLTGDDDSAQPAPLGPPATHAAAPPASATAGAVDTPIIEDPRLSDHMPVDARPDGLHVAPGVEIRRLVDDPWDLRRTGGWSVAVAYATPGEPLTWWAGYVDPDRGGASAGMPAAQAGGLGFEAWVDEQRAIYSPDGGDQGATPPGGWPGMTDLALVRFVEGTERLEPLDAVELLRQRPHPELPASWARPGDRSAVAEVVFEDTRYYVLARSTPGDGPPQYIAVKASRGGATLDDFLALARDRYAEGGGGLL